MQNSTPLQIGVLLPTREQAIVGTYAAAPLLSFARLAEELGFDSLWTGDSLTARPRLDPLVVLAAAAAATDRITLGTAALTPALRHPLISANMIASLDQVASARLVMGVGSGFPMPETEAEFTAVGASFRGRAGRLDDIVGLWRAAWSGTREEYTGRYVSARGLDRLPSPRRPGGPPVWLAGSDTPAVLRRIARHYDGWLPFLPTAEAYAQAWDLLQTEVVQAGRPVGAVQPAVYATLAVDRDRDAARAALERYVHSYYGRTLDIMLPIQAYGWGTAEHCAEWLAGYVRAGARHVVIRIGALEPESQLKEIADAVLPALRSL